MPKQFLKVYLKHQLKEDPTIQTSEMFSALVQYRVEELTNDYNDMDMELKSLFFNLGKKATVENLNLIFSKNEFQNLVS